VHPDGSYCTENNTLYFKTYNMNNAPVECLVCVLENHNRGVYKRNKWQMSTPVGTEMSKIILA